MKKGMLLAMILVGAMVGWAAEGAHEHEAHAAEEAKHEVHAAEAAHDAHGAEPGHEAHGGVDAHGHGELPGKAVELSPQAAQLIGLRLVPAVPKRLHATRRLWGRLAFAPEGTQVVSAPAAGVVTLRVAPYQQVTAGEVVAQVTSPAWQAAQQEVTLLEARLALFRELARRNPELEMQLAQAQLRAQTLQGGAEIGAGGELLLRAPVAGRVEALPVASGAWVEQGAEVLRVVDPTRLRLRCRLMAEAAEALPDGAEVQVEGVPGRLALVAGEAPGAVEAVITFAQPQPTWRVGALKQVEVPLASQAEDEPARPTVPARALCKVGLEPHLFIQDPHDADRFIAFAAETTPPVAGEVQVLNLPASEEPYQVVVAGHYELRLALPTHGEENAPLHFHADGQMHAGED